MRDMDLDVKDEMEKLRQRMDNVEEVGRIHELRMDHLQRRIEKGAE